MLAQAARLLEKQFGLLFASKNKKPSNKINVRQPLGFMVAQHCAVLNCDDYSRNEKIVKLAVRQKRG